MLVNGQLGLQIVFPAESNPPVHGTGLIVCQLKFSA